MNQKQALLKYLRNHTGITTWLAVEQLGIACLHKRIKELESDGYKITRKWLAGQNRYGNQIRVIKYCLA